jgi:hypothetical protein
MTDPTSSDIAHMVEAIDALPSMNDEDALIELVGLADAFFAHPDAAHHLGVWFRLFERFPDDDAYGVFWTVLHGLEAQDGVDALVVDSIHRHPTAFPVLMVNRMLNAGIETVDGVDLIDLLERVAGDARANGEVRADARDSAQAHRQR